MFTVELLHVTDHIAASWPEADTATARKIYRDTARRLRQGDYAPEIVAVRLTDPTGTVIATTEQPLTKEPTR